MTQIRKRSRPLKHELLECAARLAAEQGISAVTINAVAEATGVTKGGLFHHFSSRQALLEGVVAASLEKLDSEIESFMAQDPILQGRFTRAYVNSMLVDARTGFDMPCAALFVAVMSEHKLRPQWAEWLHSRTAMHVASDGGAILHAIRLAADGAWLSYMTTEIDPAANLDAIRTKLLAMSYGISS